MTSPVATLLGPGTALPEDGELPNFQRLFDTRWVWLARCARFGTPDDEPELLRIHQLRYRPGRRVVASYVAEWGRDSWVMDEVFSVEMAAGEPERLFRYPDDPYLPGLAPATHPESAADLMSEHVRFRPQRLHVDVVRYRPTSRAVLRHSARGRSLAGDRLSFYVRVMRPARMPRLMAAAKLAESSDFALPRLVASWDEGGVVWLGRIPGDTVRTLIRKGIPPDPHQILDHLEKLWSGPLPEETPSMDVARDLRAAERLLSQVLQGQGSDHTLRTVLNELGPFVDEWQPSTLAHNDFYDGQLVVAPTGGLALIDFEETGPGDPMLDVGTMLAHLHWMAGFGTNPMACESFRFAFRAAAIDRFGWDPRELDLREAFALFRLCTNPVRNISDNWLQEVETGLRLVEGILYGAGTRNG